MKEYVLGVLHLNGSKQIEGRAEEAADQADFRYINGWWVFDFDLSNTGRCPDVITWTSITSVEVPTKTGPRKGAGFRVQHLEVFQQAIGRNQIDLMFRGLAKLAGHGDSTQFEDLDALVRHLKIQVSKGGESGLTAGEQLKKLRAEGLLDKDDKPTS